MKVVILNGSPRKGGNTEIMAETFAKVNINMSFPNYRLLIFPNIRTR